jgi:hypothetical protein
VMPPARRCFVPRLAGPGAVAAAVAVVAFSLDALVHWLRVVLGWEVARNAILVPIWASVIALAIAATLVFMLRREMRA